MSREEVYDIESSPYDVLGVSEDATKEEIHSAYRRLSKVYHPDKDHSAAGHRRYYEIRKAYDMLRKGKGAARVRYAAKERAATGKTSRTRTYNYDDFQNVKGFGSLNKDGWTYDNHAEYLVYAFGHTWDFSQFNTPKERIPWSLGMLPMILGAALGEAMSLQILLRALLSSYALWSVISPISPAFAAMAIIGTMLGCAIYRYYHLKPPYEMGADVIINSFYYGVGMSVLVEIVAALNGHMNIMGMLFNVLVFYAALFPLWMHPLLWLVSYVNRQIPN